MGFDGKSIDKHHISIFILLFVYWVNNAYLFEISRFHYKERAYICVCMYVYVCMYICIYVYSDPIRSDPILRSDPAQLFGLFSSKKKTQPKLGQLRRSSEKRLKALSE